MALNVRAGRNVTALPNRETETDSWETIADNAVCDLHKVIEELCPLEGVGDSKVRKRRVTDVLGRFVKGVVERYDLELP